VETSESLIETIGKKVARWFLACTVLLDDNNDVFT
jgi:hypothetical protein